jgi:hypothetical protein
MAASPPEFPELFLVKHLYNGFDTINCGIYVPSAASGQLLSLHLKLYNINSSSALL